MSSTSAPAALGAADSIRSRGTFQMVSSRLLGLATACAAVLALGLPTERASAQGEACRADVITVTGRSIRGDVTRYCPTCGRNGGEEQRAYTCSPATLRAEGSYDLRCGGLRLQGDMHSARLQLSGGTVVLRLTQAGG